MKKVLCVICFITISFSIFALPPGLTDKPIDQLMGYIGKPVPSDFTTRNKGQSYNKDFGDGNTGYYVTLVPLKDLINSVVFVWYTKDAPKRDAIWKEIVDLMNSQKLESVPTSKDTELKWKYNDKQSFELKQSSNSKWYRCELSLK